MKTEADRATLMVTGINLAGKHVSLNTARCENSDTVKIIIKDLPLHEVSNQEVLVAVKEAFEVLSEVKYSNVFVDGKKTHLRNGDCFLYISTDQLDKVQASMMVRAFPARLIKPVKFQTCHQCGQVGHRAASDECLGLTPPDVCQSIQPFHGGQCKLSNLHVCLEGCAWQHEGQQFESSEKEFQFAKLIHHEKNDEANRIMALESTIEIK